jgi:hypothetical protein
MAYSAPRARINHEGIVEGLGIAKQKTVIQPIGRGMGFIVSVEIAASNPLVGMAADIDVLLNLRVQRDPNETMRLIGNVMGDAFPNCEVFLRDAADDTLLLHAFRTDGGEFGPYKYLLSHNFRPMGRFAKTIFMTEIGLINS